MEHLLIAIGVLALGFVLATSVAAVLVVRGVRRGYRSMRGRLREVAAVPYAVPSPAPDLREYLRAPGSAAVATLGSAGWWRMQNHRHRMWRAVSSAQHAVGVARRAEVAVGDLPALASRLHAAATGVDAVLRASAPGSLSAEDRRDCDQIVAAATELRAAALASLRSGSRVDTDTLVSAVQIEVTALAAGVRAAHG